MQLSTTFTPAHFHGTITVEGHTYILASDTEHTLLITRSPKTNKLSVRAWNENYANGWFRDREHATHEYIDSVRVVPRSHEGVALISVDKLTEILEEAETNEDIFWALDRDDIIDWDATCTFIDKEGI